VPTDLLKTTVKSSEENTFVIELKNNALSPEYVYGDRVYVDGNDCKPDGSAFAYWDGVGLAFGLLHVVPSKDGPMIRVTTSNAEPVLIGIGVMPILGKIKGQMRLG